MGSLPHRCFLVALSLLFQATVAEAQHARSGNCLATSRILPFKTAKRACESGNYPGWTVVTCTTKLKQKDRRVCSIDSQESGVYVDTCGGSATGLQSLVDACKSGGFNGLLLVRCRNGEEKSRMQCEAASADDDKVAIFLDRCGSATRLSGTNLVRACRDNVGQTLVKCRREGNIWKERKARHCEGMKDRVKFRDCSPVERATLLQDQDEAEERVDQLLNDLDLQLEINTTMTREVRKKMEKVRKKLGRIQTAFDRRRTYVCKANRNRCQNALAHVVDRRVREDPHRVSVCDLYFGLPQLQRASTLVHEVSHYETETNDKGTYRCGGGPIPTAAVQFHKRAEYYEYITECGLLIPN